MGRERRSNLKSFAGGLSTGRIFVLLAVSAVILYLLWMVKQVEQAPAPRTLVLYSFSAMQNVMEDSLMPSFQVEWKRRTGERLEFVATFAGSGEITHRIMNRVPAETAILASGMDVRSLAAQGLLSLPGRERLPFNGVVTRSPMVILVRPGNPKKIRDFPDLAQPGLQVIHSDPATSGAAQWAILAEYGSVLQHEGTREQAAGILTAIWLNSDYSAPSARKALAAFGSGSGDALVTYEEEVLPSPGRRRIEGEVIYPPRTLMSEHVLMRVNPNISREQRKLVNTFVTYLWSPSAQKTLVEYGFRSVLPSVGHLPDGARQTPTFTIGDLGGELAARRDILDDVWNRQIRPRLETHEKR